MNNNLVATRRAASYEREREVCMHEKTSFVLKSVFRTKNEGNRSGRNHTIFTNR